MLLRQEIDAWVNDQNTQHKAIDWKLGRTRAAEKFKLIKHQN